MAKQNGMDPSVKALFDDATSRKPSFEDKDQELAKAWVAFFEGKGRAPARTYPKAVRFVFERWSTGNRHKSPIDGVTWEAFWNLANKFDEEVVALNGGKVNVTVQDFMLGRPGPQAGDGAVVGGFLEAIGLKPQKPKLHDYIVEGTVSVGVTARVRAASAQLAVEEADGSCSVETFASYVSRGNREPDGPEVWHLVSDADGEPYDLEARRADGTDESEPEPSPQQLQQATLNRFLTELNLTATIPSQTFGQCPDGETGEQSCRSRSGYTCPACALTVQVNGLRASVENHLKGKR